MNTPERLTFGIPAYNDSVTIKQVIGRAKEVAKTLGISCTICVVNDGSTDATGAILKKLVQAMPELSIRTHAHNLGYGRTMKELYVHTKTPWLFTVPGDFQIDPMELIKLWEKKDEGDIIIGVRTDRQDGIRRLIQAWVYRMSLRLFFGVNVQDVDSVKLIRVSSIRDISIRATSAFVDAELVIRAKRAGKRVTEVSIQHQRRQEGQGGGAKLMTILPTIIDMIAFSKQPG